VNDGTVYRLGRNIDAIDPSGTPIVGRDGR